MNRLELGGGGGSRDTLQAAVGSQYEPLGQAFKAAQIGQEQGFGSMFQKQLQRERIAGTLGMQLALGDYKAGLQSQADEYASQQAEEEAAAKEQSEGDELSGEEQAITDHYQNVLDSYEPGSPEYEGAKRALETFERRRGGSNAQRRGYIKGISQNNFMDPFAQGTLGMESARRVAPQPDARDEAPVRQTIPGWEGIDDDLND
jgi:hypothetical protein